MNEIDKNINVPDYIDLIGRDPIELIAYKLVDPTLMFLFKNELQFEYKSESLDDGTIRYSNSMSSEYAKWTEKNKRSIHSNNILIPIILYSDGVALGLSKIEIN